MYILLIIYMSSHSIFGLLRRIELSYNQHDEVIPLYKSKLLAMNNLKAYNLQFSSNTV